MSLGCVTAAESQNSSFVTMFASAEMPAEAFNAEFSADVPSFCRSGAEYLLLREPDLFLRREATRFGICAAALRTFDSEVTVASEEGVAVGRGGGGKRPGNREG